MIHSKFVVLSGVLCISLFVGCRSQVPDPSLDSARLPAALSQFQRKPHLVFFIHGFRDDEGLAFAEFPELLNQQLEGQNVRVFKLSYPSLKSKISDSVNAFQFAKIINAEIISTFVDQGKKDLASGKYQFPVDMNTSYTIVAHSQGGVVTMNYINSCLSDIEETSGATVHCDYGSGVDLINQAHGRGNRWSRKMMDDFREKAVLRSPRNLRNIITLSSPFWGSPMALSIPKVNEFLSRFDLPLAQTQDLAIGSVTSSLARVWSLNRDSDESKWVKGQKWVTRSPPQTRIYNLTGYVGSSLARTEMARDITNLWSRMHPAELESDPFVPVPQANSDYFYYIENKDPSRPPLKGRTEMSQMFLPLIAQHGMDGVVTSMSSVTSETRANSPIWAVVLTLLTTTVRELEMTRDLAVPFQDLPPRSGENDFFGKLLLAGVFENSLMSEVRTFNNEFKLITPVGYRRKFAISPHRIKIGSSNRFDVPSIDLRFVRSSGQNSDAIQLRDNFYQTYFHTGSFKRAYAWRPREQAYQQMVVERGDNQKDYLDYRVDVMGFATKEFAMHSLPGTTSYAEVYLKPVYAFEKEVLSGPGLINYVSLSAGKTREIHLKRDGQRLLVVTQEVKGEKGGGGSVAARCHIGLRGLNTADDAKEESYLTRTGKAHFKAEHSGRVYREVLDTKSVGKVPQSTIVEILGRYRQGFRDPISGVTRACLAEEKSRWPAECAALPIDRYLIRAKSVRKGKKKTGVGDGDPRWVWINVVDVDIFTRQVPLRGGGKVGPSDCLLGDASKEYLSADELRDRYQDLY